MHINTTSGGHFLCSHLLWSRRVCTLCLFECFRLRSGCLAGTTACWGCAGPSPAPPPAPLSCPSSPASPRGAASAPSPAGTPSAGWNSQRAPPRTRWAIGLPRWLRPSTAGSSGTPGGLPAGSWPPGPPRDHLPATQHPVLLLGPRWLSSDSPALLSAAGCAPARPPSAELSASSRRRCGGGAAPRALGGAPDKIEHRGGRRFEGLPLQSPGPCPRGLGGWVRHGGERGSAEGRRSAADCRSSHRGATVSSKGEPARLQHGRPGLAGHAATSLHEASKLTPLSQTHTHTHTQMYHVTSHTPATVIRVHLWLCSITQLLISVTSFHLNSVIASPPPEIVTYLDIGKVNVWEKSRPPFPSVQLAPWPARRLTLWDHVSHASHAWLICSLPHTVTSVSRRGWSSATDGAEMLRFMRKQILRGEPRFPHVVFLTENREEKKSLSFLTSWSRINIKSQKHARPRWHVTFVLEERV